jgi:hypothetical protein
MAESSASRYWVVGGVYEDMDFRKAAGGREERLGPFTSYEDAKAAWAKRAWETVDDAHARFHIEKEEATTYWVVGGTYTDTSFRHIEKGRAEERYGPFGSYQEAERTWRAKAWETVDDAHARYRIDRI